jgi:flagellar assembly protein FliH
LVTVETISFQPFVSLVESEQSTVVAQEPVYSFDKERVEIARLQMTTEEESRKAQAHSQAIVQSAQAQAEELISGAHAQVEQFHQEGFQKGYAEGTAKAEAEIEAKYRDIADQELAQIRMIVVSFTQSYKDLLKNAEQSLVRLATDIAAKVIQEEAQKNSELVLRMVKVGLERVVEKANIVVKVHPEQLEMVKHHKAQLIGMVESIDNFELMPDTRVDRGGCVVETNSGSVEVRLEKQISELKKVLTGKDTEETNVSDHD